MGVVLPLHVLDAVGALVRYRGVFMIGDGACGKVAMGREGRRDK